MIAYKASPLHSSVRLGEGAGGDPKKSKVKSLFISPTNKPKEVKKETQEPPSRSKSVNGQDVTQPTYYIDQFNKIPVQDTPTQAINEQVTAKNNPNLTPNTQAQNLYPSVQDETTQIPKNPILTGEQPAGEVKQFNELPAIQMLKDNLFMTGALKQPIDTYMSGREDFFKGDTSKGFQKGVMSLAELTSIPFTALDQITRQIPDVGNDIADISTAPFVVLGEAGKDINKSIREFLGIKLQDPEQEKLADELAGVFMQFAVPMVGGKLMGLTKTGLKKLTEVKGVIETIPEPLRTPENVQKLLTEGTKYKNIVDPQGNIVREKVPTGDLTSTPIDKIAESKKNIEKNPNIPIDLPQLDVNAGLREISPVENFNIFKGLEPSKRQQFNEQVKPKLDEWVNDSKTPEDFINRIQREYYIGGTKKGDIISKMLVDLGYTREGALPNNPFNAYTEYYNLFKKEETVNPKYKESIETVLTDAEKKRATDFVDIKRHGNLNLNSVKDGIRLDAGKIKKGLNDIKNGNFETIEAKQVAYNINKAYENGIKGNNERGDFSNSFMSAEELKSISEVKSVEIPKTEINSATEPIKFKDTGEAIKFGKTATEEQVKQLEKQKTELDAEIEKGFSDPTYDKIKHRQNIAQYQYLDESIQTAKGTNKDILKSLEKPKNLKFKNPDTRDLYEEIKDYSDIDSKGNVTVYHRTNDASPILKTGKFKALEDGIFFSTKENGQAIGYGKEVVKLKIPLDKLALDDVFKDEAHLRIDLGRNREIDLSKYIDKKYAYQDNIKTIKDAISKKSLDEIPKTEVKSVEKPLLKPDAEGLVYTTKQPAMWDVQLNYEAGKKQAKHKYIYLTEVKNPSKDVSYYGQETASNPSEVKVLKFLGDLEQFRNGDSPLDAGMLEAIREKFAKDNNLSLDNVEYHLSSSDKILKPSSLNEKTAKTPTYSHSGINRFEDNITNKDINVKAQPYENNVKIIKDALNSKSLDMSGLSKLVDLTDKKVLKATYEIARYHFENGIQKFGDWARQMVKDAGDWIKPHLKRLWSEVKAYATGDKAMLDPNTLGLFGGGSAKEFNLAKEQGRLFEGKYDKKTRFEIDDSKAKLKVDFHEAWGEGQTKFKLEDVLDHPELFKNYPEFKDINVKVTTGSEYQGSYSPKDNTIRISLNNTDGNKSTLLHELQHGIQEVENFARGGNVKNAGDIYDKVLEQQLEGIFKKDDPLYTEWMKLKEKNDNGTLTHEEYKRAEVIKEERGKLRAEGERIVNNKQFGLSPHEKEKFYRNLAGEIEARDVQARMDYTAEQRKQIPPYSSENISPNDAIVNYETGQSNLINKKGTRKVDPDRIQQGEKQSEFTPNEKTIHGDIRKEIKDIMNKDLDLMRELRRNKITDQQALKKATEIGIKIATEGDKFFDRIKIGDVFPIEEHLGIVAYATKRVKDVLADKTATPTQKFDVMTMFYKAEAISGELGRSLRGRQLIERLPIDDIKGLGKDILDAPDIPQEHKDAVSGMLDDMQKRPNLIHQPNWYDKLRYVFYNAMLSRPLTHLRNIAGNSFHLAYEYALNPVNPVKALRNAEFKKTLAKVWKEGGDVSKFTEGMYEPKNPLVRNAMPTSWLKFEDIVFKELSKGIQKTREAKSIMKDFGGDYDVVIKAINNVMEGKTIGNEKINTRLQKAVDGIEEYAKYVTFQKDLGNVGTKFQSWLKSIKGSELIVPFVRTPANILKVGLQPLKVLKYITKEQRAKFNEMTPVEKRMEITRITAGAVAYTVLYQLASNNVIDITGQGAEDKSKRDFMEKQGWKPNSIKIGDRYYSYQNIQPFNVGLGIVGNYLDGIKYNSKPKDNELEWYQKWSKTLAGFVATTTDQSFLSGLSELAKWQQTKNPYYLEGFVNSFIPGILSVGKDFTTDTNAYDTKTVGEKLKSRTGLTDGLRPRINVFGEPEKTQGTGLPFTVIPPKLGEQETPDEMSKLFLDNNVTISYPKKDMVKADGQKVSDEEYYDFVKESGQRIKKKLDENFELLKTMDSGTMNDEIDRVVNDIRNTVKDEMFGKKERTKKQYKIKL